MLDEEITTNLLLLKKKKNKFGRWLTGLQQSLSFIREVMVYA